MYKSLEEICEMTTKEGKPFWKIVQEDDCREQGISEGEAFEQMRGMYHGVLLGVGVGGVKFRYGRRNGCSRPTSRRDSIPEPCSWLPCSGRWCR